MSRLIVVLLMLAAAATAYAVPPSVSESEEMTAAIQELRAAVEALQGEMRELAERAGTADAAKIGELERRIEVLTREIERLRLEQAAPPQADTEAYGLGPAASKVYRVASGVSIGGYGEMLYQNPSNERDDGTASGKNAQIDFVRAVLYAGFKFHDRLVFNSEIEFEHASTSESGSVAAEFAYLDFLWRDEVNIRAGLLLLPMGFINELHEPPTYLGALRPETERRIIPTTWRENGFGTFGSRGMVTWRAYVVNGFDGSGFRASGLRGGRQKGSKALAEDFAFVGRLDVEPHLGVTLGASLYSGNSAQAAGDFSALTTIVDVHGELRHRGIELRGLWTRATVDDAAQLNEAIGLEGADSIGSRLGGGYLQVGFDLFTRFGPESQSLIPFVRWETIDTQAEVPTGFARNPANDEELWTIGAAWKPHPQVVVKGDWTDRSNAAGTGVDQLSLGLGYIF